MPFGLLNAPATFCRLMWTVCKDINVIRKKGEVVSRLFVYVDDVLVSSKEVESHLEHLAILLGTLSEAQVTVNAKKCVFRSRWPSLGT
jgi:hypothetical protein